MAIPVNIGDLINQRIVESNRIEFKKSWNPNAVIRSICAFANDIDNVGGGDIIIGGGRKRRKSCFSDRRSRKRENRQYIERMHRILSLRWAVI